MLVCLLDSRCYDSLRDVILTMKRVKHSMSKEAVIFLLSFPVQQHISIWKEVLFKTFSAEKGYKNVVHYHLNDSDPSLGQAVISFGGEENANEMLSHVQFQETPEDGVYANFGESMIYVELQYSESQGAPSHTIGVLWIPDLFCEGEYMLSDTNFSGVVGLVKAETMLQRFHSLSGRRPDQLGEAQSLLKKHLAGFLLITDVRSNYFGERMPLHQWKMSGMAHVVNGTILNGEFCDEFAHPRLGILPSCYKIRPLHDKFDKFWVTNRSFDFWFDLDQSATPQAPDSLCSRVDLESTIAEDRTSSSLGIGESQCGGSVDNEVESECMVCLSRPPTCVFEKCGHLGVCGHCWKWMCKEQFANNKSKSHNPSQEVLAAAKALNMEQAAKIKIKCPYCRIVTRALHFSKHTGATFRV